MKLTLKLEGPLRVRALLHAVTASGGLAYLALTDHPGGLPLAIGLVTGISWNHSLTAGLHRG